MGPKTPSPYFVQTVSGKLELMKGTYLTMQRRKQTLTKTKKIHHIYPASQKHTAKKKVYVYPYKQLISNQINIMGNQSMGSCRQTRSQTKLNKKYKIHVGTDIKTKKKQSPKNKNNFPHQVQQSGKTSTFNSSNAPQHTISFIDKNSNIHDFSVQPDFNIFKQMSLPSIQMLYDNDEESQWPQIDNHVNNMMFGLTIAAYDRKYH